jgi:ADP-ribose pyrophosphatase YjhB (NUDIX family)
MSDPRAYPDRPFLAVSAAIVRDGRVLLVRRARDPGRGLYSLPGGVVEAGETLAEAIIREVDEETGLSIQPMALAGHREAIIRDKAGRAERHFVILTFACRWVAGEPRPSDEVDEALWVKPDELQHLTTTKGLADIIAATMKLLGEDADA